MAKILITEDDSSMLEFLTFSLKRAEHDIITAQDGLSALSILEENDDIDLLLTDIVIPGIDGVELAKKASANNPALKIMFMTGFSAIAQKSIKAANAEETRLLSKPFHLNDLLQQIEEALK